MEFQSEQKTFLPREIASLSMRPGEILVRVTFCTICGSDLHTYAGRRSAPEACVLGHEIVGTIDDWHGETAPRDYHGNILRRGQRVTWTMAVGCEDCFFCNNGLNQKCLSLFKYGHHAGGEGAPRGGLGHYCVLVPGTPVFAIPESMSDAVACPANCATATVAAAMRLVQQTHSVEGACVMIVGAGMLGVTAAAQARELRASHVIMVDPDANRQQLAKRFGATVACDPASVSTHALSLTERRGVDIALDFAGVPQAVCQCIDSTRVGGMVLMAGSVFPTDSIEFQPEQWVRRMLTVRGLHNYLPTDLDFALRFLERNHQHYPFEELVSQVFPLTETRAAFDYAVEHRPIRVAVRPNA